MMLSSNTMTTFLEVNLVEGERRWGSYNVFESWPMFKKIRDMATEYSVSRINEEDDCCGLSLSVKIQLEVKDESSENKKIRSEFINYIKDIN